MCSGYAKKVTDNLRKLIKERRLKKGLSHQSLADAAGVNRSTISRVEGGEFTPTITVCLKITNAMGESLSELLKTAGEK